MSVSEKSINAPPLPSKTVIAGAAGRMGRMLLEKCARAGLAAAGVDRPFEDADIAAACDGADLAVLCVPARNLAQTAAKITPWLDSGAILADITSVKEKPMRQMEEIWQGSVVGSHPLFGPNNSPGEDLPVALTPGKKASPEAIAKTRAFFEALGCRVFECGAKQHDQAMAKIQNMNFITTLAYFAALAGQEDLLPFLTPSFERRKAAAAKMLTEDAEMFTGLFEANSHSHEAARQFRKFFNLAASGDIELLCRRAQWWWKNQQKNEMSLAGPKSD